MIQITLTRKTLAILVAAFVAVASLAAGALVRSAQADDKFNDIATGTFFHESTGWLADNAIANGYPDGSFKPNNNVTRGQASFWFNNYDTNIVGPHVADTTDVHGIADTSALANDSDLSSAIAGVRSTDDIEIVSEVKAAVTGTTGQQATPDCPSGKRPIGGGSTPVQGFYTAASYPNGQFWHIVWNILPPSSGADFPETTAYAVCVPDLPAP